MTFLSVHFNDEAERIGTGRRTIFVEKTGRLWVALRCPYTLHTARLRKSIWATIERQARPARVRLVTIDRAVHFARAGGRRISRRDRAAVRAMRATARQQTTKRDLAA